MTRLSKSPRNSFINNLHLRQVLVFSILLSLGLTIGYILTDKIKSLSTNTKQNIFAEHDEITKIKELPNSIEKSKWYLKLIERVGPKQAQEDLEHSGLPHDGNTHLINHTVGDYLYRKYGPGGITYCKSYFSSSCYHGIIIDALADGKLDKIDAMMETCRKTGKGPYGNCMHGLGHGFLSSVGYKQLLKALALCDEVGDRIDDFDKFTCHTGVFMENIWGVHEGKLSPDRWIKDDDPHYPCSDPRIPDHYLAACWQNQSAIMHQLFQGDYAKIAKECEKLQNQYYQNTCFDGIFNLIQGETQQNVDSQFKECSRMPEQWRSKCLISQVVVEISHGDSKASFEICARINSDYKKQCYQTLNDYNVYYSQEPEKQAAFCNKIPREYREKNCLL